jgi:hypothetical protein
MSLANLRVWLFISYNVTRSLERDEPFWYTPWRKLMIPNRKAVVDCAFHSTVFDTACSTGTGCGMGLRHHAARPGPSLNCR